MFKADDYRLKIQGMREVLKEAEYALDIEHLRPRLAELEKEQENPDVWQDLEKSTKIGRELAGIRNKINAYEKGATALADAEDVVDLIEETEDESLIAELDEMLSVAEKDIEDMRIRAILKGPYDNHNAMLALHAGAGGTEACDWCQMLYRMYCRYCEKMGFKVFELDREAGDGAGLKSVDFRVEGENAYGYLKAEMGVHRLVRISPFDSAGRRHTSFCSCELMPVLDEDIQVEINMDELRIDTYRASGAGGQHINKTSSAIRITHIPTGTVVQCQNERSQFQNKDKAMQMLKAKLFLLKQEANAEKLSDIRGEVKEIGWGNQIRSYVMQPYTLVKDHRTNFESGNVDAVMDGAIDGFINAYLKWKSNGATQE